MNYKSPVSFESTDEDYMRQALKLAEEAYHKDEVPIGTVIVHQGKIIARAYNQRQMLNDPTAHAEMIALTQAAEHLRNWRLAGCTIYVTLEPCPMCAGALVLARIDRLVYAAKDPSAGACGSLYNIVQDKRLNHSIKVESGVLADQSQELLRSFFRNRRQRQI